MTWLFPPTRTNKTELKTEPKTEITDNEVERIHANGSNTLQRLRGDIQGCPVVAEGRESKIYLYELPEAALAPGPL